MRQECSSLLGTEEFCPVGSYAPSTTACMSALSLSQLADIQWPTSIRQRSSHAAVKDISLRRLCKYSCVCVLPAIACNVTPLGTQEICCPKCHFSSVQNYQFRPKFRPNF